MMQRASFAQLNHRQIFSGAAAQIRSTNYLLGKSPAALWPNIGR
jgi:hypothetical protein